MFHDPMIFPQNKSKDNKLTVTIEPQSTYANVQSYVVMYMSYTHFEIA